MRTEALLPTFNSKSFYDFVKLSNAQKVNILTKEGIFLDLDNEKDTLTRLYFLNGFFVEETICKDLNEIIDIIPFKQGYRIENYVGIKKNILNRKPIVFNWSPN